VFKAWVLGEAERYTAAQTSPTGVTLTPPSME